VTDPRPGTVRYAQRRGGDRLRRTRRRRGWAPAAGHGAGGVPVLVAAGAGRRTGRPGLPRGCLRPARRWRVHPLPRGWQCWPGGATPRNPPGRARLVLLPGVGHDLPAAVWPRVAGEVRALADRATVRTGG